MEIIRTTPVSSLVDELEKILGWLEELGVRIGQGRLATYAKIASEWDAFLGGGSVLTLDYLYPRVSTLAYEVPAFLNVFKAFGDVPPQNLVQIANMLRKAVHGTISVDEEQLSRPNAARDYLFEALTAAHVHHPQRACHAILNSPSDTGFVKDNYHVYIECKRLSSEAGLQANVRKAADQLEKAFQRRHRTYTRGLVALDVSKFIRPANHILSVADGGQIGPVSTVMLAHLVDRLFDELQRHLSTFDRRIIGFMIFSNFVAVAESDQLFVNVGRWSIVQRRGINPSDKRFLASLPSAMAR
jgi:hypothetical protein